MPDLSFEDFRGLIERIIAAGIIELLKRLPGAWRRLTQHKRHDR